MDKIASNRKYRMDEKFKTSQLENSNSRTANIKKAYNLEFIKPKH